MPAAFSARLLLLMLAVTSPLCHTVAHEAEPDTVHAIEGVTVVGRKGRDIIPGERLSGERLKGLNTVSVAAFHIPPQGAAHRRGRRMHKSQPTERR